IFAKERNITISRLCHLNNPLFLFDEDAMHKVIANLLSNAIKFTPNNGNIIIYVASIQKSGEEVLYIAIKDNGTGIANEDVDKIFNRFYQSRSHVKYPVYGQSGTGIGLYLCKRIIQLNNGSISAKNNRAGGSTFRMTIPLIRENQQENAVSTLNNRLQLVTESSESLRDKRKTLKTTILVVEDNNDMRAYIRSILEETYHVIEAENGAVALTKLSEYNVDFIISDLMMPVMDGLEFSKKVKENFNISHIPFLMLTAKTSSEAKLQSYKIGVDEYLLKPFDEEMLLTRIQNILENRKRYQQQFSAKMEIEELQIEEESSDKKFIDKVMEIVKANYKNSYYEISDLVEAMGISKSLFNKKMQSLVGQPAGQFLRNYRLNIAYELILKNKKTKNMNISEIAYEVGFNDPKYFTRCFTKHFNVLPSSLMDE
ncbi:MAG: response regulator, partial [Parabacteroides sp.]